jgi:hypothetical protein
VLQLPFVVLLPEDGADESGDAGLVGEIPTMSARRLTSLFKRSIGLVGQCAAGNAL